jgi:hypothetical protein
MFIPTTYAVDLVKDYDDKGEIDPVDIDLDDNKCLSAQGEIISTSNACTQR